MKPTKTKDESAKRWLSYRPEIKVLDCTIRDGGLMNNHHFDDKMVKLVYDTCVAAGIDYMELGYKASRQGIKAGEHGCWKYCVEEDLRRVVGDNPTDLKLCVMADAERCDYHEDIPPKKESVVDMIRVAAYITQIPTALDMVKDAHDKGYETTVNLMAASIIPDRELEEGLEMLAKSEAKAIYVVDSFGACYSEQVRYLVKTYLAHCKAAGMEVGVHMHNNLQLAYANTIEGIIEGANYLDATMAGLGRGAGNCPMELIVGFLHNPKCPAAPRPGMRAESHRADAREIVVGLRPAVPVDGVAQSASARGDQIQGSRVEGREGRHLEIPGRGHGPGVSRRLPRRVGGLWQTRGRPCRPGPLTRRSGHEMRPSEWQP